MPMKRKIIVFVFAFGLGFIFSALSLSTVAKIAETLGFLIFTPWGLGHGGIFFAFPILWLSWSFILISVFKFALKRYDGD